VRYETLAAGLVARCSEVIHGLAGPLDPSGSCLRTTRRAPQPVVDKAGFGDEVENVVRFENKDLEVWGCIVFEKARLCGFVYTGECSRTPLAAQR
jgi:hypothetical protein